MDLFTALANHWILVLLILLVALGAIVRGVIQLLAGSMRRTHPEQGVRRARRDEIEADAALPAAEPFIPAAVENIGPEETADSVAEDPDRWRRSLDPIVPALKRITAGLTASLRRRVPPPSAAGELAGTVAAAFQYLASREPERAGQIPLYLVAGPAQAGKSTLLAQTRLPWRWRQNQRTFGSASGIQWTFCEEGVLLELPGGVPDSEPDGNEDVREIWKQLPRLLLRHRPRRPLEGVVLVLPADLLLEESSQEIARRSERSRLWEDIRHTAHALAMHLPLYVIVSKCDLIPGFVQLADEIPALKRRDGLGWSNPHPMEWQEEAVILDEACRELRAIFLRLTAEAAMAHDLRLTAAEEAAWLPWMELDRRLPAMLDALRLKMAALLHAGGVASLRLRGIYLCGNIGERAGAANNARDSLPAPRFSTALPKPRLGFAETLFLQRVFPGQGLAVPAGLAPLLRQPRAVAMQRTAAALLLVLGLGAASRALHLTAWRDQRILPMLQITADNRPVPPVRQLQAIVRAGEQPLRSWLLPASWFSGVNAGLQQRMQQTLETRVYPALAQDLQQQARQLAQHWVAIASNPPAREEASLRIARPEQLAEFTTLQRFSHDWLQLQDAIDAYQGLAHADARPSPADAQRFLTRLGAAPSAPLSASAPVYRAIIAAHGPAFVYAHTGQNEVSQVMRDLVRRLLYRWYTGNELVSDLQRWNRLPDHASPHHGSGDTARASLAAQIRRELADPVLASVLQDGNRPAGPLDSIPLTLVHRSGYLDPDLRTFIQNEATGDAQQVRALAEQLRTPSGNALIAFKDGHWQLTAAPR